jgi:hypothetical protein
MEKEGDMEKGGDIYLGQKMKGKIMTYLSFYLRLCLRESDKQSSNSKHGFGGWLSFPSLSLSLSSLSLVSQRIVCQRNSVVVRGDWGRERDGSLPKAHSVK